MRRCRFGCRWPMAGWGSHDGRRAPALLPRDRGLVPRVVQRAHARPGGRLAGDQLRPPCAGRGPHRFGQDAVGLPLGAGPAGRRGAARVAAAALPGALRLPAQGSRRRRRTQPEVAAGRDRPRRGPAGPGASGHPGGGSLGRHSRGRPSGVHQGAVRHPHHDARVAVPHAHLERARGAHRRRDGHRGRGPRGRGYQAGRPPRTLAGAARPAAAEAGPTGRAVRDGAAGGRGGALPRGGPSGRRRAAAVHQGVGPRGRRPAGRHVRARRGDRGPQWSGGRRAAPGLDLAARGGAHRRPRGRPPLDAGVRQLAPAGGAADGAPQRDLGGAAVGGRGGRRQGRVARRRPDAGCGSPRARPGDRVARTGIPARRPS